MTDEERNCNVCGTPVMYGERHHKCGSAVMIAVSAEREAIATIVRDFLAPPAGDRLAGIIRKRSVMPAAINARQPNDCERGKNCSWTDGDPSTCRRCGKRSQGSGQ